MKMTSGSTRYGIALAMLLLLGVAVGCSSNQTMGQQIDDAAITAKIEAKLTADPEVSAFNVDVDTEDGVVRLSGAVEKASAKREAAKLARNTEGVVRVMNEITIGDRSMADRFDDGAIVTKIKAKLTGDSQVSPFNVDVDSKDGVVTLSGSVDTAQAKREAESLAKDTEGVRRVQNRIKVVGEGR